MDWEDLQQDEAVAECYLGKSRKSQTWHHGSGTVTSCGSARRQNVIAVNRKRGTDKMASLWKWLWHYCQLDYECWVVLFPSMDWPERRRLAWTSEKTPGLEQGWAAVAQQWHEKRGGLVQLLGKRSGLAICKRPRRLLAKDTWCFPRLGQCCWRTDRLAPDIHFESGRPKIHYRSGGANARQVPQTTISSQLENLTILWCLTTLSETPPDSDDLSLLRDIWVCFYIVLTSDIRGSGRSLTDQIKTQNSPI